MWNTKEGKSLTLVVMIVLLAASEASAAETTSQTISAPGSASTWVSPDQITIHFGLETVSYTFAEAIAAAEKTATKLQGVSAPADGVTVDVDYDVTFMRQKKWGGGRKLDHKFKMEIQGVAEGKAQGTLVHFIDSVLTLEPKIVVEYYNASLSDSRSREFLDNVLAESVANARRSASVLAESGRLVLGPAHSIRVGSPPGMPLAAEYDGDGLFQNVLVPSRAYFSVHQDFPSSIELKVNVWVVFQATSQ